MKIIPFNDLKNVILQNLLFADKCNLKMPKLMPKEDINGIGFVDESKYYYTNGYALRAEHEGTKYWYNKKGVWHREEGPAIIHTNGNHEWYFDGLRHRKGGPACEFSNGTRIWFNHGLYHRENGPAIIYNNGKKEWWVRGKQIK